MTQLGRDDFSRADQSGWGTATDGNAWTPTGTGTFSISGSEGVLVSNGSDTSAQLGTATSADAEIVCRVAVTSLNDVLAVQARYSVSGGNVTCYKFLFYTGGIHINKSINGANSNLANFNMSISTNTFYWMHFWVQGSNLYGKFWQDGTAEPKSWTISATDSSITTAGGVAVLANTDSGGTGVKFDHFYAVDYSDINQLTSFSADARAIALSNVDPFLATDSFYRFNQSGSWGTASDGQVWSVLTGPATPSINNNEGVLTGNTTQTILTLGSSTPSDCELLVRLANTQNTDSVFIIARASNASNFYRCRILNQALTIQKVVGGGTTTLVSTAFTVTAGNFYWIRFRIVGSNLWAKAWADGSAEPTSWTLTTSDSSLTSGNFGLAATLNAAGNTASFDSFYVVDYSEVSRLTTFASDGSASGNLTITEQLTSLDATTQLQESVSITEQLSLDATGAASGGITITEQLSSIDAILSAQQGSITVIEQMTSLDATTQMQGSITITEQLASAYAEAIVVPTLVIYSHITFTATNGTITLAGVRGNITIEAI